MILASFVISISAADLKDPNRLREEIQLVLHVPNPLPNLHLKRYGEFVTSEGVVGERVSYTTKLGMRVPAIVC